MHGSSEPEGLPARQNFTRRVRLGPWMHFPKLEASGDRKCVAALKRILPDEALDGHGLAGLGRVCARRGPDHPRTLGTLGLPSCPKSGIAGVQQVSWCRSPLDRFILARLEAAGVAPAPAADWRTLIRRVSLDLTGLPPTAEDVETFVSDPSPDAYAPGGSAVGFAHYGENWGRHWLDVVRYADTAGKRLITRFPWRGSTGTTSSTPSIRTNPMTSFFGNRLRGHPGPKGGRGNAIQSASLRPGFSRSPDDLDSIPRTTITSPSRTPSTRWGRACWDCPRMRPRCHAHKFDPVPMQDYYALYGIFDSTRYSFPGSEQSRGRAPGPAHSSR